MNTVAKNIKRLRTQNNMTQDALAEKMHVTRQTVSNWETGKNQPDIDTLDALSTVFATDINELIYGNKKDSYIKYQKKYVRGSIISALFLAVLVLVRLTLLPYLKMLRARTYTSGVVIKGLEVATMAAIFFCIGFFFLAVLSLWFDCSVKNFKLHLFVAIVCLIPVLIVMCECISWSLISKQTPMYILGKLAIYSNWLSPILVQILPAIAGVSVFSF